MKRTYMLRTALGGLAFLAALPSAQAAQKTFVTKDASGTGTLSFCAFDAGTFGIAPCHVPVTSGGVELFTATNPGSVALAFGGTALTLGQKASAGSIPVVLPSDGTQATAALQGTANTALGAPTDTAYAGSGSASNIAALKGIYAQIGSVLTQVTTAATAGGAPADTAYAGTGSASEIAALKGLYSQIGSLLTANGGVADAAYAGSGSASQIAALKGLYTQLGTLLAANGAAADAAYAGSGSASQIAALKGIYAQLATIIGQAAPTSPVGTSIAAGVQVSGFQGVTGGVPVGVVFGSTPTINLGTIGGAATAANQNATAAGISATNAQAFQGVTGGVPIGANIMVGGVAPSLAAPLPFQVAVAGAAASPTNPLPVANSVGGAAVSATNPMPVDTVVRSTATSRSTILPVQEASDTVAAGGTGAAVGDVLTIVGGTLTPANAVTGVAAGTAAKCTVTGVSSGAVTACAPVAGSLGSYTVLPVNPVATTTTGAGSGTTLNVVYTGLAIPLAPANATRRGLHVQPQGAVGYLRGAGATATADYNAIKINADALYETSPAFVGTGAISMIAGGAFPVGVFVAEY